MDYDNVENTWKGINPQDSEGRSGLFNAMFIAGRNVLDPMELKSTFLVCLLNHVVDTWKYCGRELHSLGNTSHPESLTLLQWWSEPNTTANHWKQRTIDCLSRSSEEHEALEAFQNILLFQLYQYSYKSQLWHMDAEHVLRAFGSLDHTALLRATQRVPENHNVDTVLSQYPAIYQQWLSQKYDSETLDWAGESIENTLWLATHHPRWESWELVEAWIERGLRIQNLVAELGKITNDGALLKAWYGVELEMDEVTKHPLAHSLHVHKHAPVYLQEVVPLPSSWMLAMNMATTGRQFCNAVIQADKAAKGAVNQTAPELALPNLGENPHL